MHADELSSAGSLLASCDLDGYECGACWHLATADPALPLEPGAWAAPASRPLGSADGAPPLGAPRRPAAMAQPAAAELADAAVEAEEGMSDMEDVVFGSCCEAAAPYQAALAAAEAVVAAAAARGSHAGSASISGSGSDGDGWGGAGHRAAADPMDQAALEACSPPGAPLASPRMAARGRWCGIPARHPAPAPSPTALSLPPRPRGPPAPSFAAVLEHGAGGVEACEALESLDGMTGVWGLASTADDVAWAAMVSARGRRRRLGGATARRPRALLPSEAGLLGSSQPPPRPPRPCAPPRTPPIALNRPPPRCPSPPTQSSVAASEDYASVLAELQSLEAGLAGRLAARKA